MRNDKFGQLILSEDDICNHLLTDPSKKIKFGLTETEIYLDEMLDFEEFSIFQKYQESNISINEFDDKNQQIWFMPESYNKLDIAQFVLDACETQEELQRAGEELILYQEKNLFPLLKYLKYLVDTMRENNVVWGVGRGSSVASFVLYLIGVHRINSLYYDLSIDEFLK
jgi:DNA polymerase III alpha subunit